MTSEQALRISHIYEQQLDAHSVIGSVLQVSAVVCIEDAEAWTKLQQAAAADAVLDLSLPDGKQNAGLRGELDPKLSRDYQAAVEACWIVCLTLYAMQAG